MMRWYRDQRKREIVNEYNTVAISLNLAMKIHEQINTSLIVAKENSDKQRLQELSERLGQAINARKQ